MLTPAVPSYFVAPRSKNGPGGPERRFRRFSADRSFFGWVLWGVLFASVRLTALALGALAAGLVIAGGLMLCLLPAQFLGWVWILALTLAVMGLGTVAADAAAAVIRFVNNRGDGLLYQGAARG